MGYIETLCTLCNFSVNIKLLLGFPGGSKKVVLKKKNPSANAGDTGSIPEIFPGKTPHATEQLSLCATTMEPVL